MFHWFWHFTSKINVRMYVTNIVLIHLFAYVKYAWFSLIFGMNIVMTAELKMILIAILHLMDVVLGECIAHPTHNIFSCIACYGASPHVCWQLPREGIIIYCNSLRPPETYNTVRAFQWKGRNTQDYSLSTVFCSRTFSVEQALHNFCCFSHSAHASIEEKQSDCWRANKTFASQHNNFTNTEWNQEKKYYGFTNLYE